MTTPPIACTLDPQALAAQRDELLPGLVEQAVEHRPLADGSAWRFTDAPGRLEQIARVIDRERCCCRFLAFRLVAMPEGGALWLEVTGPPGTPEMLRTLLAP